MWTRKELKTKAKADIKVCYWKAVLVSFIVAICAGGSSGGNGANSGAKMEDALNNMSSEEIMVVLAVVLSAIALALIIALVLKIFVFNPLLIGGRRFFAQGTNENGAELSELGYAFKNNYKNQVKVSFMCNLLKLLYNKGLRGLTLESCCLSNHIFNNDIIYFADGAAIF